MVFGTREFPFRPFPCPVSSPWERLGVDGGSARPAGAQHKPSLLPPPRFPCPTSRWKIKQVGWVSKSPHTTCHSPPQCSSLVVQHCQIQGASQYPATDSLKRHTKIICLIQYCVRDVWLLDFVPELLFNTSPEARKSSSLAASLL